MKRRALDRPTEVLICMADHFEPDRGDCPKSVARELVSRWTDEYPAFALRHVDSYQQHPKHTFFFPIDQYDPEHLDRLAKLCEIPAGGSDDDRIGDVEIHLHHADDTSAELRDRLEHYKNYFWDRHGLLRKVDGDIRYGFIHGNWALDNSHPLGKHCGVNNELTILRETGCYADFTMPSAPANCQTSTINEIYYAFDDPAHSNSHNRGIRATSDGTPPADALLMIQGPLALDWSRRKLGIGAAVENGAVQHDLPPSRARLQRWLDAGVHIAGRSDQIFIKLHTHGAVRENADILLGDSMHRFHKLLADMAATSPLFRYRYVTAFQMAAAVIPLPRATRADQGAGTAK